MDQLLGGARCASGTDPTIMLSFHPYDFNSGVLFVWATFYKLEGPYTQPDRLCQPVPEALADRTHATSKPSRHAGLLFLSWI